MLSCGDRLPNPDFCPPQISTLIQLCFHGDPNGRPNFKEIMSFSDPEYIKSFGIKIEDLISFAGGWSNHNAPESLRKAIGVTQKLHGMHHFLCVI